MLVHINCVTKQFVLCTLGVQRGSSVQQEHQFVFVHIGEIFELHIGVVGVLNQAKMALFGHLVGVVRDPPVDVSNNNWRYVRVRALVRSACFGDNFVEPHHGEDIPFGEFPGHAARGLAPIVHVAVDVLEGIDGLADGARSVVVDMWSWSGVLGVAGIVRSTQGAAGGGMCWKNRKSMQLNTSVSQKKLKKKCKRNTARSAPSKLSCDFFNFSRINFFSSTLFAKPASFVRTTW